MRDTLEKDTKTNGRMPSTAVLLTDSALLMPVLHHLPDKDVNVSMGYPLTRSPLNRLLDALLRLQEGRSEDGRYYWRTLLQCLRHPYLNMLRIEDESGRTLFLRDALRRLEALVRTGNPFCGSGGSGRRMPRRSARPAGHVALPVPGHHGGSLVRRPQHGRYSRMPARHLRLSVGLRRRYVAAFSFGRGGHVPSHAPRRAHLA